jgi:hypothetical protein
LHQLQKETAVSGMGQGPTGSLVEEGQMPSLQKILEVDWPRRGGGLEGTSEP